MNYLTFVYTLKCTARCKICCFGCNVNRHEKITLEQAKRYIDSASTLKSVKSLGFTGGEPVLFLDEICAVSNYALTKGFASSCLSTNGYWASSTSQAREKD